MSERRRTPAAAPGSERLFVHAVMEFIEGRSRCGAAVETSAGTDEVRCRDDASVMVLMTSPEDPSKLLHHFACQEHALPLIKHVHTFGRPFTSLHTLQHDGTCEVPETDAAED